MESVLKGSPALFLAAALSLQGAARAVTKVELDQAPYKDPEFGYELKVFRRWNAIPAKPGERSAMIRTWSGDDGQSLQVFRWDDAPAGTGKAGYQPTEEGKEDGEASPLAGAAELPLLHLRFLASVRDPATLEKLEKLRKEGDDVQRLSGEEKEAARAACLEGYRALLGDLLKGLEAKAREAGVPEAYREERNAFDAIARGGEPPAEGIARLLVSLGQSRGMLRHLLSLDMRIASTRPFPCLQGLKGTRYDFTRQGVMGLALEYPVPGSRIGLLYLALPEDMKRLTPLFEASAKSFRPPPTQWKAPGAAEIVADDPRSEARAAAGKSIMGATGWWQLDTPRYIIVSNLKKDSRFPRAVAEQLEAMRDLYERLIPTVEPILAISIVRICKSLDEYLAYGAPPGSAGYWSSYHKELVLFGPESGGKVSEDNSLAVVRHEAFHQYVFYAMGNVAPHSWLNEGTGDFFSGGKLLKEGERTRVQVGEFDWRNAIISQCISAGTHVPLEKLVRYSQNEYYANATLCYAEGWSLVYYLLKGTPEGSPYRSIIPTYLETLQECKDARRANEEAFAGIDMKALEADWMAFYKNTAARQRAAKSDKIAPMVGKLKPAPLPKAAPPAEKAPDPGEGTPEGEEKDPP